MKTKLLSVVFAMLTVCGMWSQNVTVESVRPNRFWKPFRSTPPSDTTDLRPITFPFWMVREIALDLEEKELLEQEAGLFSLELESYQKLVGSLEEQEQQRKQQLELLGKNISLLELRLRAEQQSLKGVNTLGWSLRLLAALGAGFLLGRL